MRRLAPWVVVWGLTLGLTVVSSIQSLERYWAFGSAWPWDLAYNNQWFWALEKGDQILSIRPLNSWGTEGPSIWVRTHLDPIRLLVAPFYPFCPRPEILIVANNIIIWLVLPAAYGLVKSESGSVAVGLSGAALVPFTPLLWPMLWNDFREMELAIPFVLWAIQGYRSRHRGLLALGAIGMIASREEFSIMLASFALLPPKVDEEIGKTYAWARTVVSVGVGWMIFIFLGSQRLMIAKSAPTQYLEHFNRVNVPFFPTFLDCFDYLIFGLGSWSLLALLAPRVAILVLPWLWGLAHGRWVLSMLGGPTWSHLRYAAPVVAPILAAGLIGYARLGLWTLRKPRGGWLLAGFWVAAALGLSVSLHDLLKRMDRIEQPISATEAKEIWKWVEQVGPEDVVMSSYETSAVLSSRRWLFSNRVNGNAPAGYPQLGPEFRWAFLRRKEDGPLDLWTSQGFKLVYEGDFIRVLRRDEAVKAPPGARP